MLFDFWQKERDDLLWVLDLRACCWHKLSVIPTQQSCCYRSCPSCLDRVSYTQNNPKKNHLKEWFIGTALLLWAGSIHLWPLLADSLCHEDKTLTTFLYHSLSESSPSPLKLHSMTLPWPDWMLHVVYGGIIQYVPQNNSPLTLREETSCSQSRNARSLFIGLLFLGKGGAPTRR